MRRGGKQIPSYWELLAKTKALYPSNPTLYSGNYYGQSNDLVEGLGVRFIIHATGQMFFVLHWKDKPFAQVFGGETNGRKWTEVAPIFRFSEFRVSMLPWLPFEMTTQKFRGRGSSNSVCRVNRDGTPLATGHTWDEKVGVYFSRGKRRSSGAIQPTARFVFWDDTGEGVPVREAEKRGVTFDHEEWQMVRRGWIPGMSETPEQWLRSVNLIPNGLCDKVKVMTLMARSLSAGRKIAAASGGQVYMLPASKFEGDYSYTGSILPSTIVNLNDRCTGVAVLHPANGPAEHEFVMPAVIVHAPSRDENVMMLVPPVGNQGLNPVGRESPWCIYGTEYAYHAFRAFKMCLPVKELEREWGNSYVRSSDNVFGTQHGDKYAARFDAEDSDRVLYYACSMNERMKPAIAHDIALALTPEEIFGRYEEHLVLEALPLC